MLILLCIGIISILWLWRRRNKYKNEPPLSHGSKILIGHALQFAGNSTQLWNTIKKINKESLERGGVLKVTIGPRTLYVLTDPEDCLTVSKTCLQKDAIYEFARPWIGDSLLTSLPSQWKVHRKLLNPAFSQPVLDNFMDVFNNKSRSLVNTLKVEVGKGLFSPVEYLKYNTLETICLTAMGVDLKEKSIANTEYVTALEKVLNILITRFQTFWLHNNVIFNLSSLKKKQDSYIKVLHDMAYRILKVCKENMSNETKKKEGLNFKPFMELLLDFFRDTKALTNNEIREYMDTMIVAGYDTLATVVNFCMVIVGSLPQVQEKIHEELKSIFGDEDRDVRKQDLPQLLYLEAVIKETMRLYPIVPVLENYTLYKGNSAYLFIYGINRHSTWGPDVEEFKPERWLDPSTLPDSPISFAGFGVGRTSCIGQNYAMMSMKVVLTHIYRNYIIHGDYRKLEMKLDVTIRSIVGHHISIKSRK